MTNEQYQFGCGILKMVGQKINILKGNHCILRIPGAHVRQKLGMILESKVVQKLKFSKNVNNKRCAPKIRFFNEQFFRKIWVIFDIEN